MILLALALVSAQAELPSFRVTFNRIGGQGGVQRVVIQARTANEARRQAEIIYHAKPMAVVPVPRRKDEDDKLRR